MYDSYLFRADKTIKFSVKTRAIQLPDRIQNCIKSFWEEKKKYNNILFNGTVYSIESTTYENDTIILHTAPSNYAHYLGSEEEIIQENYRTKTLYTSAIIETSEGNIGIARMGENSFEPGRIQFIGGSIDPSHIKESQIDFKKCIESEMLEEINIDVTNNKIALKNNPLFYSFGKVKKKASIIFHIQLSLTSDQLTETLQKHNNQLKGELPEVKEFIFFKKSELSKIQNELKDDVVDENLWSSLRAFLDNEVERDPGLVMNIYN